MSVYESSITNPKKQLEFYKDLSEQLQRENQQLKNKLKYWVDIHMDLKKWLEEEYKNCDKIVNPAIGYAMGQIKRIQSKIQELEKEN